MSQNAYDPPAVHPSEAHVKLLGGSVLRGRVVGRATSTARPMLQLETDFGRILVPAGDVTERVEPPVGTGATFHAAEIRVVRIEGVVERQIGGEGAWAPLTWPKPDDPKAAEPLVKPGDRLRTGAAGEVDLQFHTGAWTRVLRSSEISLPGSPAPRMSLQLLRGSTLHHIAGQPRGETFRVATPTALLGVKGTIFQVDVLPVREGVTVAEGTVLVEGHGPVTSGQRATWAAGQAYNLEAVETAELGAKTVESIRLPPDDMVYVPGGMYEIGGRDHILPTEPASLGPALRNSANVGESERRRVGAFLIDRREATVQELWDMERRKDRTARTLPDRKPALTNRAEAATYLAWVRRELPTPAGYHPSPCGQSPRAHARAWARA